MRSVFISDYCHVFMSLGIYKIWNLTTVDELLNTLDANCPNTGKCPDPGMYSRAGKLTFISNKSKNLRNFVLYVIIYGCALSVTITLSEKYTPYDSRQMQ